LHCGRNDPPTDEGAKVSASAATTAAIERLSDADRAAYEAFCAITCPIEQARAITAWGRPRGTLRSPFRELRLAALAKVHASAQLKRGKAAALALRIGFSPTRFSRLTRHVSIEGTPS
jgi:hypothetical protein